MSNSLEIMTLGGLTIRRNDRQIDDLTSRKALALLIYLAHGERRTYSREVLSELLWEERTQGRSLSNLRVLLTELRKHLEDELVITRQTVSINPDIVLTVDSIELETRLEDALKTWDGVGALSRPVANKLTDALDLYTGDFLDGFYVRDSQAFETWAYRKRERLRLRVIAALDSLITYYLKRGPATYSLGIDTANRLLELDPLHEETHRNKMLLLALIGLRSEALSQYDLCRQLLADELGVQLAAETLDLYDRIQHGDVKPPREETVPLGPIINRATHLDRRHDEPTQPVRPPAAEWDNDTVQYDEIVCEECGHISPAGALICESCGHEFVAGSWKRDTTKNLGETVTTGRYFAGSEGIILHFRETDEPLHIMIPADGDVLIGRWSADSDSNPDVDLTPYQGAEQGVSRIHASLKRNGDSLVVTDLNSTNGTLLNGQKLHPGEVRVLRDGDALQFGNLKAHVYFQ